MKILPVGLIREADKYTIEHEPIADIDLMERAAAECFYWMVANLPCDRPVKVFCGPGNNGGDGFALARMLSGNGFNIEVYFAGDREKMSPSCKINHDRLHPVDCTALHEGMLLPAIGFSDIVVDAIFGSGITREVTGIHAELIRHINKSNASVISIDMPSGLICDATVRGLPLPAIVKATHTLTFSPPKLALLFPENGQYAGDWHLLDIGLRQDFIDTCEVKNFYITGADCSAMLHRREKFSHKGTYGHLLLIAGSRGKMGAAVLAARASLRSGAGLVTVHVPGGGVSILQTAFPEAMVSIDPNEDIFTTVPDLTPYSAIAIGPGIGKDARTANALKLLIQNSRLPLVIDADAINILAENKTWLGFLPPGSVFTPHPKEFERLVGKSSDDFQRNQLQHDFSFRHSAHLLLKGAHSAITTPTGHCYFNSTGNPGMATGGSGDVLTGVIAGLQAQGYSAAESVILGTFIHGRAGDMAADQTGYESLIASDIIHHLGTSFQSLYGKF
jgi:ADP-dependent NAD(P)H-hydrate dehydratase / NAD(P)H-hydrate epimerase